jgi:hypothetical protein
LKLVGKPPIFFSVKNKLLFFTAFSSLLLYLAIAFNISPYLRGPHDPVFESHWPYYFVNTFSKVWLPVLIGVIYVLFFLFLDKRIEKTNRNKEILLLGLTVILVFLFQISLVYFSRFGITVLFRRIVDPGINGYFTAAIHIDNVRDFLQNYPSLLVSSLPQHSRGDPPGPVLIMYFVISFFKSVPLLTNFLIELIRNPATDAKNLWIPLADYQKVSAVFLGFLMHFLSAITIIPFYFLIKNISTKISALRSTFIWGIIPSLTFFSLIFDPFYTIFPILSFLFLVLGYKRKDYLKILLAGIIFSFGLFFNISILPLLLFLILLLIFVKNLSKVKLIIYFSLGLVLVPLVLLFFGYNSLTSGLILISSQTPRDYLSWLLYNPYDVFVYMGIPVSILFIIFIYKILKNKKLYNLKIIILAYLAMFFTLVVSGISRGEVGRIWISLMILPVGVVSYYLTEKLKYSSQKIAVILILIIIQCIVLEEFWVPIW